MPKPVKPPKTIVPPAPTSNERPTAPIVKELLTLKCACCGNDKAPPNPCAACGN